MKEKEKMWEKMLTRKIKNVNSQKKKHFLRLKKHNFTAKNTKPQKIIYLFWCVIPLFWKKITILCVVTYPNKNNIC